MPRKNRGHPPHNALRRSPIHPFDSRVDARHDFELQKDPSRFDGKTRDGRVTTFSTMYTLPGGRTPASPRRASTGTPADFDGGGFFDIRGVKIPSPSALPRLDLCGPDAGREAIPILTTTTSSPKAATSAAWNSPSFSSEELRVGISICSLIISYIPSTSPRRRLRMKDPDWFSESPDVL